MPDLITVQPIGLPSGRTLRLYLVPFVEARFDTASFLTEGIACPPALKRSVRKRQVEFFHGRVAARAALCNLDIPTGDIPVGAFREPIWPAKVVGSISHVDGLAAAVAGARSEHLGLGIDLERTVRGPSRTAALEMAIDVDELTRLQAAVPAVSLVLDELVTLAFSAKEALFKAAFAFVGRFFGFEAARVEAVDAARRLVVLVITENLAPEFPRGRRCEVSFVRLDGSTFVTAFEVAQN